MIGTVSAMWFKLRSIELVRSGSWTLPLAPLSGHLLLVPAGGGARASVDGSLLRLRPGSALVGRPGQLASVAPSGDSELFALRFDALEESVGGGGGRAALPDGRPAAPDGAAFPLAGVLPLADAAAAAELCRRAVRDWADGGAAGRLRAQAALHELLGRLLEGRDAQQSDSDAALRRTIDYMERHCGRAISIDELAETAGLSRYYYMRLFKAAYGISAMDYLTQLRIDKAKRLMERPGPKLRDIARQVGFGDEFYFIRRFKQQVGIPPATYIRNRQRRIAAYSFPNIGQLLALRHVPFAAPMDHAWTDLYRHKYRSDVKTALSHDYEFNRTALRAARPDFIIGVDAFVPSEEQERIRAIAPALFVPWRTDDWRGHLRRIGAFLDVADEAEAWLRRYDREADRVRELLGRSWRRETVLVAHQHDDGCYVYGRKTVAGVLYDDLGLPPAGRAAEIDSRERIEPEQLVQCGADRILLMLPGGNARGAWERLRRSGAWRRADTALGGKVTPIAVWPWFDYSAYVQEKFLLAAPALLKP